MPIKTYPTGMGMTRGDAFGAIMGGVLKGFLHRKYRSLAIEDEERARGYKLEDEQRLLEQQRMRDDLLYGREKELAGIRHGYDMERLEQQHQYGMQRLAASPRGGGKDVDIAKIWDDNLKRLRSMRGKT